MMLTLEPTNALSRVDFPAFGAPMRAMKPQLVLPPCVGQSAIKLVRRHTDPREHRGCSCLLSGALGTAEAFRRRPVGQHDGHAEFWIVMRASAGELTIGGRWQAPRLRPFLQHGLRIA